MLRGMINMNVVRELILGRSDQIVDLYKIRLFGSYIKSNKSGEVNERMKVNKKELR